MCQQQPASQGGADALRGGPGCRGRGTVVTRGSVGVGRGACAAIVAPSVASPLLGAVKVGDLCRCHCRIYLCLGIRGETLMVLPERGHVGGRQVVTGAASRREPPPDAARRRTRCSYR